MFDRIIRAARRVAAAASCPAIASPYALPTLFSAACALRFFSSPTSEMRALITKSSTTQVTLLNVDRRLAGLKDASIAGGAVTLHLLGASLPF